MNRDAALGALLVALILTMVAVVLFAAGAPPWVACLTGVAAVFMDALTISFLVPIRPDDLRSES